MKPGTYKFKCLEVGEVIATIELRNGEPWAQLDGIWNSVQTWNDALTECKWEPACLLCDGSGRLKKKNAVILTFECGICKGTGVRPNA